MTDTANLGLTELEQSQSQKHVTINGSLRVFDTLLHLSVIDRNLSTPPVGPSEGDRYLIGLAATDAWLGAEGLITSFQSGVWVFFIPRSGWRCWVADESINLYFNGAAWIESAGGGGGSSPYLGTYLNTSALDAAHPTATAGNYAYVDAGAASDIQMYIWDDDDTSWVLGSGGGAAETSASVKTKYEANADTNAFTNALLSKLNGIEADADVNLDGSEVEALLDAYYGNSNWRTSGTPALPAWVTIGGTTISSAVSHGTTPVETSENAPVSYIVEPDSTANLPISSTIFIMQGGAGLLTIAEGAGVTLLTAPGVTLVSLGQYAAIVLFKHASNTWKVYGELASS